MLSGSLLARIPRPKTRIVAIAGTGRHDYRSSPEVGKKARKRNFPLAARRNCSTSGGHTVKVQSCKSVLGRFVHRRGYDVDRCPRISYYPWNWDLFLCRKCQADRAAFRNWICLTGCQGVAFPSSRNFSCHISSCHLRLPAGTLAVSGTPLRSYGTEVPSSVTKNSARLQFDTTPSTTRTSTIQVINDPGHPRQLLVARRLDAMLLHQANCPKISSFH